MLLSEVFEDPIFNQLLETMGKLGANCVPVMIRALLNWRSNQSFIVDGNLKNLVYVNFSVYILATNASLLHTGKANKIPR